MAGPSPVDVYVPHEGTDLYKLIDPGSGVVGHRVVPEDPESPILLYFEGNRFNYANVHTFADRCMIAEGRLRTEAPTIARTLARPDDVRRIGVYFPEHRRVEIRDGLALTRLAKWLGLAATDERGVIKWNDTQLGDELRGSQVIA